MHFFIPGTHPKLSQAELEALDPQASFSIVSETVLVGELQTGAGDLLNKTAGVVKAGEIFSAIENYNKETLAALLAATVEPGTNKFHIGLSVYNAGGAAFQEIQKDQSRLGLELKSLIKETGRPVRFVTSKDATLSSVVVQKNHLLENGAEFVLIVTPKKILIGQTTFVQDFEAWGHRDFGRPARDAKSGMLPPKLARLMVNLSGVQPEHHRLWDPFCGSGTILMEAAMLGYPEIVGSDISEKAIADTERNLRWLEHHEKTPSEMTMLVHDAMEPLPDDLGTFDAIIAEGYLGPSRPKSRGAETLNQTMTELEKLYQESIPQVMSRLNPDGVFMMALPFFQTRERKQFLQLQLPSNIVIENEWLYARAHQHVGRQILKMKKRPE